MIAFYYALTGLACAIYWRHELFKSAKNFLFIGIAPLIGGGDALLPAVRVGPSTSPTRSSPTRDGAVRHGLPLAIAVIFIALGFLIMVPGA